MLVVVGVEVGEEGWEEVKMLTLTKKVMPLGEKEKRKAEKEREVKRPERVQLLLSTLPVFPLELLLREFVTQSC